MVVFMLGVYGVGKKYVPLFSCIYEVTLSFFLNFIYLCSHCSLAGILVGFYIFQRYM